MISIVSVFFPFRFIYEVKGGINKKGGDKKIIRQLGGDLRTVVKKKWVNGEP